MIKECPAGKSGCIEDFHLIAQKRPLASPISLAGMSEPLINHTSFQWSRGQIREGGGPPSVRLPGWNNPGSTGRERRRQDEGLKGKKRRADHKVDTTRRVKGSGRTEGELRWPLQVARPNAFCCKLYFLEEEFLRG